MFPLHPTPDPGYILTTPQSTFMWSTSNSSLKTQCRSLWPSPSFLSHTVLPSFKAFIVVDCNCWTLICLTPLARPQAPGSRGWCFFLWPQVTATYYCTNQAVSKHTEQRVTGQKLAAISGCFFDDHLSYLQFKPLPSKSLPTRSTIVTTAAWPGFIKARKCSIFLANSVHCTAHLTEPKPFSWVSLHRHQWPLGSFLSPSSSNAWYRLTTP